MATINKKATYFKQVASVIGEEAAWVELQKVIDSGCDFAADSDGDILLCSFEFAKSPQGFAFWRKIADECGARNTQW